ncbi:class I SAM-dependent RNA methyltransferase [Serinibacter arcticus]|uniref:23S rRNA (Uracil-5-)-methyltransferase RumA n=1 Tax=Serinibacter arcticus TaxID=1655435 RepID=A0A4Z1DZ39_9MICO|nr:TRAM domain-containing protein [Serinibacter arcticus]TGO04806.1 23S rRNA (Uracil-5-) -methyltransferase RumA [Serinibacter arcticus]
MTSRTTSSTQPGDPVEGDAPAQDAPAPIVHGVTVGAPAHGGHAVARHEGRVIFVRHAAPGEVVDVTLTEHAADARFWRGDATRVLEPSPDRVRHVWPEAGPGGVGGGELGHLSLEAQRAWKAAVVNDTLRRIGKLELADVEVEPVPGETDGLGTRTRIELVVDDAGRLAMHPHRSHDLVALRTMPLAVPEIAEHVRRSREVGTRLRPGARVELVRSASGLLVLVDGEALGSTRKHVRERVLVTLPNGETRRYEYRVAGGGFWQVHHGAARLLIEKVLAAAEVRSGDRVVEAYSGAGLLTLPLADAVGETGTVVAIEGDDAAVRNARRNAHAHPWVELVHGDVATSIGEATAQGADVVVLDPPRAGAGADVVAAIVAARPRRIVYVSCDPASLARDLALLVAGGATVRDVRGYDLFPHTHHVEAVAVLDGPA